MKASSGLLVLSTTLAGVMMILAAGCNQSQEAAGTPPPRRSVGTELDDSVVTARVKSALVADQDIKGFAFKVETRKGEVQLSGFVANQTQVDRAIAVTRGVAGVKNTDNKVSRRTVPTAAGSKIDDGIVTAKVKTALLADAKIKSLDIAVLTREGEVQLSGFVDNQGQIDRAIDVARGIVGVRSVSNEMSIKK